MKLVILGHLMNNNDLRNIFPLGKVLPIGLLKFITANLPAGKSFRKFSQFKIKDIASGYLVGLPLTAEQVITLPREKVRKKILAATLYSQNILKADIIMLGALTSSLTEGGKWLPEQEGVKIAITSGNSYTVANAVETTEKIADLCNYNLAQITIAVVGATGNIGEAISKILLNKVKKLILVGRDEEKLKVLQHKLQGNNYITTTFLPSIKEAEIIITATSHPTALIKSEHLKKYAVVIDVAEPSDIDPSVIKERKDIIAIDGGRVSWSDISLGFNIGLSKNTGLACITEGFMMALEKDKENHVGTIDLDFVEKTKQWGKKYNWGLADFTNNKQPIPEGKFKLIRENVNQSI